MTSACLAAIAAILGMLAVIAWQRFRPVDSIPPSVTFFVLSGDHRTNRGGGKVAVTAGNKDTGGAGRTTTHDTGQLPTLLEVLRDALTIAIQELNALGHVIVLPGASPPDPDPPPGDHPDARLDQITQQLQELSASHARLEAIVHAQRAHIEDLIAQNNATTAFADHLQLAARAIAEAATRLKAGA